MGLDESEVVGRLKEAGNKLLQPPTSKDELRNLLEEVELVLTKVEQCPSQSVQEALLPAMKALIADSLIKNSDSDIKIMVAVCFNEITRITAPDAPYDDDRMKEVFELIVASFDKLSLLSGRSYDKALSIIDNAAKVRSCVMMLDLECEKLIIKMFEQFLRNIRSDHPQSVFSAMETIMTLIIDESEEISLELLKVLLDSVRKENEKASSMSWELGAKVIENGAEKLKPYVQKAIKSGDIDKDDYGPLVDSISQSGSDDKEKNDVDDSMEQVVAKEPAASATSPVDAVTAVQSGTNKSSKALEHSEQMKPPVTKAETEPESEAKSVPSKRGRKPNSRDSDDKNEASSKKFSPSLRGRTRMNSSVALSKTLEIKSPVYEPVVIKKESEICSDSEEKNHLAASVPCGQGTKKVGRPKKDAPEGSGNKSVKNSGKKEKDGVNETSKKVTRRKRDQADEVFETPYGIKKYKEDIVGCRIKVWWPMDKAYYEGCVASYNPSTMKHRVNYDDGDVEILNLMKEKFEFIADEDDVEAPSKQPVSKESSARKDEELKNGNGDKSSNPGSDVTSNNKDLNEASGRPSKSSVAKTEAKERKVA